MVKWMKKRKKIMEGIKKMDNKYYYVVALTFFAGSNDEEDTDRRIYVLKSPKPYTKSELSELISKANEKCQDDEADGDSTHYSYEQNGVNIDTLMNEVVLLSNANMVEFDENSFFNGLTINGIYQIEQWQ